MRLLLVEDDALLGGGLRAALTRSGFIVTWVKDGRAGLDALQAQEFEVVVLDIGLPVMDGLEMLRRLRAAGHAVPVLVLTARDTTRDKVLSLENGADDHVVKTAEMEELIARIRALIRRSGRAGGVLCVGDLLLDLDRHSVTQAGSMVSLSKREFDVLRVLMEGAGRVLTRGQIEKALYGWGRDIESNTVEVHIHNLRHKLTPNTVKTIRGVGYTLLRSDT